VLYFAASFVNLTVPSDRGSFSQIADGQVLAV